MADDFVTVARVGDLAPGTACRVEVDGHPVCLCNLGGEFFALGDTCTHEEASLSEGDIYDDEVIACPKHGAEFEIRTGKVRTLPATKDEPAYDVRVQGDEVQVRRTPRR